MSKHSLFAGHLLAAVLLIAGISVHAEDAAPSLLPSIIEDAEDLLSRPARWNRGDWQEIGLAGVAIAGAGIWLDKPLRENWGKHPGENEALLQIERFGAEYSIVAIGGFYLSGTLGDNSKSKSVARDALSASIIASGIITPAIKLAAGRSRPYENMGHDNFNGTAANNPNSSFPSGHTTEAFALASVISAHYDQPWVQYVAYSTATIVGAARIYHDAHFTSDVLAGAYIGYSVGHAVTGKHSENKPISAILLPEAGEGYRGLKLNGYFR